MESDIIVVLFMTAASVGFVVWLAIHSRRHPPDVDPRGHSANFAAEAQKTNAQGRERGAKAEQRRA